MKVQLDIIPNIPPRLLEATQYIEKKLLQNGFQCYLVGGSVRDALLENRVHDLDFTTNATPQQIISIFKKTIPVGIEFGTVIILSQGIPFEITTFRAESNYENGRHPKSVFFSQTLEEDVIRRDFTINGLAYSLKEKCLYDYVNGLRDLKSKIIRTIGIPKNRFEEDGLRAIRACRFSASLNFTIETKTKQSIPEVLPVIQKVSKERLYDEWQKTLKIKNKFHFWKLLYELQIIQLFFSPSSVIKNQLCSIPQIAQILNNSHIKNMAHYMAIFIYINHTLIKKIPNHHEKKYQHNCFHHFNLSIKVQKIAMELAYSPILELNTTDLSNINLKKILSKITPKNVLEHFRFFYNIQFYYYNNTSTPYTNILKKIRKIYQNKEPIYIKDLAITGTHLLEIGIQGKQIGKILKNIQQKVIEQPSLNTTHTLINFIKHKYL